MDKRKEDRFNTRLMVKLRSGVLKTWGVLKDVSANDCYPFEIHDENGQYILDWTKMIQSIIHDVRQNIEKPIISAKFHNTLVEMAVDIAQKVNMERIVLSGGCFQNKYLQSNIAKPPYQR